MHWAEKLLLFWAAFSQFLLRCLRGRLRILFQKVVRKSVWAVWGNSYLTGLHLELLKKKKKNNPELLFLLYEKHKASHPMPTLMGMIDFLHVCDQIPRKCRAYVPTCPCPGHYTLELLQLQHRCMHPKYGGVMEARLCAGHMEGTYPRGLGHGSRLYCGNEAEVGAATGWRWGGPSPSRDPAQNSCEHFGEC